MVVSRRALASRSSDLIRSVLCGPLVFDRDLQILRQGTSKVNVSGEGVDFLPIDQQLHPCDRGKVEGERVNDGVDRQHLAQRTTRMCSGHVAAQIDIRLTTFSQKQSS